MGWVASHSTVSRAHKSKRRGLRQGFVGEIEFSLQVDVLPAHGERARNRIGQGLPLGRWGPNELLIEVETVPARNCVLHEPFTGIGDLLLFPAGVGKLSVLAIKYGPGEVVESRYLEALTGRPPGQSRPDP